MVLMLSTNRHLIDKFGSPRQLGIVLPDFTILRITYPCIFIVVRGPKRFEYDDNRKAWVRDFMIA